MTASAVGGLDSALTLLVTGGTGFVVSVLTRQWLESEPASRAVILDAAPMDEAARRYFGPVADRLTNVVVDVTRPEIWREELLRQKLTQVVDGGPLTPNLR